MIDYQVAPKASPEQLQAIEATPEFTAAPEKTPAQSAEDWKQASEAEAREALDRLSAPAVPTEVKKQPELDAYLRSQMIINGGSVLTARHDAVVAAQN